MRVAKLHILADKSTLKLSYKSLNRSDKNRVKKSPNLLQNRDFVVSRVLKNRTQKRRVCLSHKDGICFLVSGNVRFGIDAEKLKDREIASVCEFCFDDDEMRIWQNSSDKLLQFYKIFTTKEALIKLKNLDFGSLKNVNFCDKNIFKTHQIYKDFLITIVCKKRFMLKEIVC
ncbi:phosphopantetheinyl transferase family protein [Campylobacter iguaniorum]|uniref:Phosphopantetheinyl transferase family protein n=1 Tax=Campylobacter iguaniorum TaxID=1244531 RepID=A0A076FB65_9BACT|nr:4'-phosphopantetheinyl transferase superfamily protein [Campylobacter iguaniorum]AII15485.1 phosphopantetheinyl transferase family protein [Campylobacter iguaniorum]